MSSSSSRNLFRLNVVFHKFLLSECYEELSPDDIDNHLHFVGVNGRIQKHVPKSLAPLIILESELPWYNPFMQFNRFCESSVLFHAWRNPVMFLGQPYIGFLHYDMRVKKTAISWLTQHITAAEAAGRKVVFAPYCHTANEHLRQVIGLGGWARIIQIYNDIYETKHSIEDILGEKIPLYHTFVLHKELFHQLMTFAEVVVPRLFELVGHDTRHLPFMLERMHGVFLTLRRMDGATGGWLDLPGIVHEDALKDAWEKTPTAPTAS